MKNEGTTWPVLEKEVNRGWPWGESIKTKKGNEEIRIHVDLDIPSNPTLSEQRITIMFSAELSYPYVTGGGSFGTRELSVNEKVNVLISSTEGEPLSAWSSFWVKPPFIGVIAVLIWFIGIGVFCYRWWKDFML